MTYYHFYLIFQSEFYDYRKLRDMIISMNRQHSLVATWSGEAAHAVNATLDKKREEIWRRMHSDSRLSRGQVALDSRAMAQSDKDIKELLLACAERSRDPSLRRFAKEFDWHVHVVDQVVEKEKEKPPLSQINRKDMAGTAKPPLSQINRKDMAGAAKPLLSQINRKDMAGTAKPPLSQIYRKDVAGKERQRVNKGGSFFWISTVSNQCCAIVGWLVLNLAALPSPVGLGFAFMVAGVLIWVWLSGSFVVKGLCVILVVIFLYCLQSFLMALSGCL